MPEDKKNGATTTAALTAEEIAVIKAMKRAREPESQVALWIYSRDGVQLVPLTEGHSLVIGRSLPADVAIRDDSLSRQHASVELSGGEVWVEDHSSTNGTWLDGERIERAKIDPGKTVIFGAVSASVHVLEPAESQKLGLISHDRFQLELECEAHRSRAFGRPVALLMLKNLDPKDHLTGWFHGIRSQLRPFDRVALYSQNTVEILLPECSQQQALDWAATLTRGSQPLLCGIGLLPDHAASPEELLELTRKALQQAGADNRIQTADPAALAPGKSPGPTEGLVARSPAMKLVLETIEKVASKTIPVLIYGETGSGKEVVARAIHESGNRKTAPMRCINCGAIPSQLLESTLFGHEKGAFTGADQQSRGVFESADGGTVLLDEIGELPAPAQAALLRVLETKKFARVGSEKEIEVDVRVLAATHRNLETMVEKGTFRQDLLYRLNAMTISLPPIRERPEEIEPLISSFIQQANQANNCQVKGIDTRAFQLLLQYSWPGNVRELRNAIDRAVVIARGSRITVEDLPERIRELAPELDSAATLLSATTPGESEKLGEINLRAVVARVESDLILRALRENDWDRKKAAQALGLPVRTLGHKIQSHGITKDKDQ